MKQNNNFTLKAALLSVGFITAATNAIAGNIPAITKSFPNTPLYIIELITTIPSLTTMLAILCSGFISLKIGHKNTILVGSLLCGIGGTIPYFFQDIIIMLLTRAIFGFGVGCITAMLLNLIIYFFDGKVKSQMIGLQGSIGGLGSFITTFIAGKLLVFGWNVSFLTYFIGFIVFVIIFIFVPPVKDIQDNKAENKENNVNWLYIIFIHFYLLFRYV